MALYIMVHEDRSVSKSGHSEPKKRLWGNSGGRGKKRHGLPITIEERERGQRGDHIEFVMKLHNTTSHATAHHRWSTGRLDKPTPVPEGCRLVLAA